MGNGRIAFNIFFLASSLCSAGEHVSLPVEGGRPRVKREGRSAIVSIGEE
jgi:hypothetical protein